MEILFLITIFILGASLVSFLTLLAKEYPIKNNRIWRRSCCDYCQTPISWFNTIPILGYLITFGKSKCCNKKITPLYPFSELSGGIFLTLAAYLQADLGFVLPLFVILILFSFMDYYQGYIYIVFYPIVIPSFIIHYQNLFLLTGLTFGFTLYSFAYFSQGLGLGDVEILIIISTLFGPMITLWIILLACILCLIQYLKNKKRSFRFIPFLTTATGVIYLIFNAI